MRYLWWLSLARDGASTCEGVEAWGSLDHVRRGGSKFLDVNQLRAEKDSYLPRCIIITARVFLGRPE